MQPILRDVPRQKWQCTSRHDTSSAVLLDIDPHSEVEELCKRFDFEHLRIIEQVVIEPRPAHDLTAFTLAAFSFTLVTGRSATASRCIATGSWHRRPNPCSIAW